MISKDLIIGFIEEFVGEGPLFLVDIQVNTGNRIHIELDGDNGIGIHDCANVSRFIDSKLDREVEDFELQVSSAGVGNPLLKQRQYRKNIGREVALIKTDQSELIGTIESVGDTLELKIPANKKKKISESQVSLAWEEIKECKVRISFK